MCTFVQSFKNLLKKKKKTELQRSQGKNINLHYVIDFNCLAIKYEGNFKIYLGAEENGNFHISISRNSIRHSINNSY